jgi:MFS family permease
MIWMPSYLAKSLGFSLTKSGMWTAVTVLGMGCGIWAFGQLADRIGRKLIIHPVPTWRGDHALRVFTGHSPETLLWVGAIWVGAIMGMAVNGTMAGIGALMSEAYPTAARAMAQNVLFNVGRTVGARGPLAVGTLAAKYSFNVAIALLASIYVLDIMATRFLIPELESTWTGRAAASFSHGLVWMTRLLSQEPGHRECVEDSKGKRSVGLRRIVGKRADDAVKRLHYGHGDSQKRDCHAGTNADRNQDRQQQGDASRGRILGEAVVLAWAK